MERTNVPLNFLDLCVTIILRHELNIVSIGVHFYFGKNACPFCIPVEGVEVCVAATDTMRFLCAVFAAHLFIFAKKAYL